MSGTIIFLGLHSQEADIFMKINAMRANIKLLDFHNVLNAPRIVFPVPFVPINV